MKIANQFDLFGKLVGLLDIQSNIETYEQWLSSGKTTKSEVLTGLIKLNFLPNSKMLFGVKQKKISDYTANKQGYSFTSDLLTFCAMMESKSHYYGVTDDTDSFFIVRKFLA